MTRTEMIRKLGTIPFNVLNPDCSWKDLGFTESPIWIDGLGYGYYYCDEPNIYYKGARIPDEIWKDIRKKLESKTLMPQDLYGTSLSKMYFCEDEEFFSCDRMLSLLDLPVIMGEFYYCVDGDEDMLFFKTKEEMVGEIQNAHYAHDTLWKELPDDLLACWIKRLCNGKYDRGFNFYEYLP